MNTQTNNQGSAKRRAVALGLSLVVGSLVGLSAWAAFAPIPVTSRDEIFEIPKGTWSRRMAGDKINILPDQINLTLGFKDVLVLKNSDDVPQMFGPALMMPGQSFSLPFAQAASYQFACSAHASGQMTVNVDALPVSPWERLRWRASSLLRSIG